MKTTFRFLILAILSTFLLTITRGQNIILKQTNETGIYKNGQKIQVTLFLKEPGDDSVSVKIRKNYSGQVSQRKVKFSGETLLIFDETMNEPSSVIFETSTKTETASIGLVVDPEKFKPGTNRPKDFDRFWKEEKKALRALPITIKEVPVKTSESGYYCSNMEISCTGPKPARGYFAKPVSARPKSLPIVLYVHAAGVKGSWCRSEPANCPPFCQNGTGRTML